MTSAQQAQYLRDLPKFKAIHCSEAIKEYHSEVFFKNHEYLLPYYGDAPLITTQELKDYKTDGRVYMIRNGVLKNGEAHYMTYSSNENSRLSTLTNDDNLLSFKLWQKFTKADGSFYLYNIGAQAFMYYKDNKDWHTYFTAADFIGPDCTPYLCDDQNHILRTDGSGNMLGSDMTADGGNNGIWSDKNTSKTPAANLEWYFEEYKDTKSLAKLTSLKQSDTYTVTAKSYSIPKGYKVGFMIRKVWSQENDTYEHYMQRSYINKRCGECYADGRLNSEINRFPDHFVNSSNSYQMQSDDPRVALFTANNKTYLCFEDGRDCNFDDLIIEVSQGVELVDEPQEVEAEAYTMCFEDRPLEADYDLNDVVLRCVRINKTQLQLSLIATGADDNVEIHGATGWAYDGREVHDIFGATEGDSNGHRFINTVPGGTKKNIVTAMVTVAENTTIPEYLKNIYIENKSRNKIIRCATAGEPPFGIIIPQEFNYPQEQTAITYAYPDFIKWAQNASVSHDWYLNEVSSKTYPTPAANQ